MLVALRQRNFALLLVGGLVSMTGDWVFFTALPFYMYGLTGSALASGAVFIALVLPNVLFGSVAGVFVDRWDRKRTMIAADVLRAVVLLLLLLADSRASAWIIYVVAFAESTIGQIFGPAKNAMIPHLVREEHLLAANSLSALADSLARILGPALGGLLIARLGIGGVALVDAASYLLSGAAIYGISVSVGGAAPVARASVWAAVWRDWREGLGLMARERLVSGLFVVMGMVLFALGIINVLLIVFVKEILGGGAVQFGWVATARGIGGLVGGVLTTVLARLVAPERLIPLCAGAVGLLILATLHFPSLPVTLALVTLLGIPEVALFVSAQTLLQGGVSDRYRGRVFGVLGTIQALLLLIGMGLASTLGDRVGIMPLLNLSAFAYLLAGGTALAMLPRSR